MVDFPSHLAIPGAATRGAACALRSSDGSSGGVCRQRDRRTVKLSCPAAAYTKPVACPGPFRPVNRDPVRRTGAAVVVSTRSALARLTARPTKRCGLDTLGASAPHGSTSEHLTAESEHYRGAADEGDGDDRGQ